MLAFSTLHNVLIDLCWLQAEALMAVVSILLLLTLLRMMLVGLRVVLIIDLLVLQGAQHGETCCRVAAGLHAVDVSACHNRDTLQAQRAEMSSPK